MSDGHEFLFYTGPEGNIRVEVFFRDEALWLSQKRMAELFGVERSVITKHLKNIFLEGELEQNTVCAKFAHTAKDGNLSNTILSLRCRHRCRLSGELLPGYPLRIWATGVLREYMIKGFAMEDARLKLGQRLFSGTARTYPGNPCLRMTVLPENH